MAKYTDLVEAGTKFLDTSDLVPRDWRSKIDLNILDLHETQMCVLGQIFSGYYNGLQTLGLSAAGASSLGFGFTHVGGGIENKILTEAWKEALSRYATADIYSSVDYANEIVSLLDGLTLKQLRANEKSLKDTLLGLRRDLTL